MSNDLNAIQRLAVSRALLSDALRDPVWLLLVQRLLKERPPPKTSPPVPRS